MEKYENPSLDDDAFFSEKTSEEYSEISPGAWKQFLNTEEVVFRSIHQENNFYLEKLSSDSLFAQKQEKADIHKAEMALAQKSDTFTLPEYLKNYVDLELNRQTEIERDSIVVKLFKQGTKFIQSTFHSSTLEILPQVVTSVRSAGIAERMPAILMEEEVAEEDKITYQIIKESQTQAYLSINFNMKKNPYTHVTLKKNDRMLFSNSINEHEMLNFSGLGAGIYSIEFMGENITKSFDLKILVD
ncbi:MAG: hypothetical protein AAF518_07560 [Spirochaetota bacterium]